MDVAFFGSFGLMALFAFVLNIAFLMVVMAIAVIGIRWLVRSLNTPAIGGPAVTVETKDTALATLRERFARSEIDADEYEQRRRTLGG